MTELPTKTKIPDTRMGSQSAVRDTISTSLCGKRGARGAQGYRGCAERRERKRRGAREAAPTSGRELVEVLGLEVLGSGQIHVGHQTRAADLVDGHAVDET